MNNKSITPNPQQPVDRVPTGQLPSALAELSEATLATLVNCVVGSEYSTCGFCVICEFGDSCGLCSYDGDDE